MKNWGEKRLVWPLSIYYLSSPCAIGLNNIIFVLSSCLEFVNAWLAIWVQPLQVPIAKIFQKTGGAQCATLRKADVQFIAAELHYTVGWNQFWSRIRRIKKKWQPHGSTTSPAVGDFYGTRIVIWAGFGPNGQLSCLYSFKILWPMKPPYTTKMFLINMAHFDVSKSYKIS